MQYDWTFALRFVLTWNFYGHFHAKVFKIMGCSFKILTEYQCLNKRVRKAVMQAIELAANTKFLI